VAFEDPPRDQGLQEAMRRRRGDAERADDVAVLDLAATVRELPDPVGRRHREANLC
jgi:hypothetical protein